VIDLSSWTVVIVDDEPDNLEVLYEVLSMYDAQVHPMPNGREALALLQTLVPTLVITDLSMPEMDGYELLTAIRAIKGREKTPVIALTAHAMLGDKERILSQGFDGYVTKPIGLETVVPQILEFIPTLKTES
jgi:two-component system cell cycle response regulator